MSLFQNGLPASFFGRGRAVIAGVAIAGAAIIFFNVYAKAKYYFSEPATAPVCYGDELVAGTKTIPLSGRYPTERAIEERPAAADNVIDRLTLALRICTEQSCPRAAWEEYRSTLFWYLSPRLQHTSRLYREYGSDGLTRARQIYIQPLDVAVEEGLRKRYAAGIFRINDFRQNTEAVAILVLKGADALRPCSKSGARTG
jgi:hypothetical protein